MTSVGDDFEEIGNTMKTDDPSAGQDFSFLTEVDPTKATGATNAPTAPSGATAADAATVDPYSVGGLMTPRATMGPRSPMTDAPTQGTAATNADTLLAQKRQEFLSALACTQGADSAQKFSDLWSSFEQSTKATVMTGGAAATQGTRPTANRGRGGRKSNASTWGGRQTDGVTGKATNGGRTETITKPGQKSRKGHKNDKLRGGEKGSDETLSTIILTAETKSNGQTKATTREKSKAWQKQKEKEQGQGRSGGRSRFQSDNFDFNIQSSNNGRMPAHARALFAMQEAMESLLGDGSYRLSELSTGYGVKAKFAPSSATGNTGFKPGQGWGGRRSRKG